MDDVSVLYSAFCKLGCWGIRFGIKRSQVQLLVSSMTLCSICQLLWMSICLLVCAMDGRIMHRGVVSLC